METGAMLLKDLMNSCGAAKNSVHGAAQKGIPKGLLDALGGGEKSFLSALEEMSASGVDLGGLLDLLRGNVPLMDQGAEGLPEKDVASRLSQKDGLLFQGEAILRDFLGQFLDENVEVKDSEELNEADAATIESMICMLGEVDERVSAGDEIITEKAKIAAESLGEKAQEQDPILSNPENTAEKNEEGNSKKSRFTVDASKVFPDEDKPEMTTRLNRISTDSPALEKVVEGKPKVALHNVLKPPTTSPENEAQSEGKTNPVQDAIPSSDNKSGDPEDKVAHDHGLKRPMPGSRIEPQDTAGIRLAQASATQKSEGTSIIPENRMNDQKMIPKVETQKVVSRDGVVDKESLIRNHEESTKGDAGSRSHDNSQETKPAQDGKLHADDLKFRIRRFDPTPKSGVDSPVRTETEAPSKAAPEITKGVKAEKQDAQGLSREISSSPMANHETVKTVSEAKTPNQKAEVFNSKVALDRVEKVETTGGDGTLLSANHRSPEQASEKTVLVRETTNNVPRSFQNDILSQLVDKTVFNLKNGQTSIRMNLKPDIFGPIRMQVTTENNHVAIKILTEAPLVRDIIQNNVHQLKAELHNQGLEIEKFDVSVNQGQYHHSNTPNERRRMSMNFANDGKETDEDFSTTQSINTAQSHERVRPDGRVDYFA